MTAQNNWEFQMAEEYIALQTGIILLVVISGLAGVVYLILRAKGIFK